MRRVHTLWIALVGACALAVPARTQDATPTPRPTPTPTAAAHPRSLAEVARRIRLQRPPGRSTITISNDNLLEMGKGGHLTTASGTGAGVAVEAGPGVGEGEGEEEGGPPKGMEAKRQYWRERYRQQLKKVEEIRKRIQELDREIPRLWTQFYSWDDPAYRDGVIKPKLDQALAERDRLGKRLPEEEAKLPQIKEAARRDGALPGWFRNLDRE